MKVPYFWPYVIGSSFKPECDHIKWQAEEAHIEAWKQGKTGFPIVDASMRCLNKSGYMHNKLRTVVCSFLVKDILADWRIGEKYFANQLVDYDMSLNNGGWQWTASVGTDAQPEPRVYNPVMQSEKLDPDCEYIIKWIPELKNVKIPHIHNWERYHHLYKDLVDYPAPIFSHQIQKEKAIKMFADCKYVNKSEKLTRYDTEEYSSYTYSSGNNEIYNKGDSRNNYKGNTYQNQPKENTIEKEQIKETTNYTNNNNNYRRNYNNNKPKNPNESNIMNMIHGGNSSGNNIILGPKKNYKGK
jgi:hypothetical protein